MDTRPADSSQALELGLPVSAMVYVVVRLRTLNAEPVLLERYVLSRDRFAGLERHDLESRSVFEVLESEYGTSIARGRQSLEPVIASPQEADLLTISTGAPLMLERRLSFDARDRPVELGRDLYRGDRFRFVTESAPREL
jgi:GntR family transcriptional regulator